jgi:beta-glucosidase
VTAVGQLYIHQRWGTASRPVRQLEGFKRVALKPGETQTLNFKLGKDELQFWDPQSKKWVVEPSTFDIWAGEDSTATLHSELMVTDYQQGGNARERAGRILLALSLLSKRWWCG